MSGVLFPNGVDKVARDWTGDTFEWALLAATWTPNPTFEEWVADVAPGNELTDASYSRQAVTGAVVNITLPTLPDGTGGGLAYDCDDPAFGVLSGAEVAAWLVLYRLVTNDANSELVAAFPCAYTADGVTAATFILPAAGAVSVALACPSGFY